MAKKETGPKAVPQPEGLTLDIRPKTLGFALYDGEEVVWMGTVHQVARAARKYIIDQLAAKK